VHGVRRGKFPPFLPLPCSPTVLENATHKLQKMSYIHAVRDGVGGLMRGGECGLGGTGQAWAKKMKRRKQETKPNPGNQQNPHTH
jgi:hypothetical protein